MLSTFLFLDQIVWAGRTGVYKVCSTVYGFTLLFPHNKLYKKMNYLHGDKHMIENSSSVYAEQGASRIPWQDSILLLSRIKHLYYYHWGLQNLFLGHLEAIQLCSASHLSTNSKIISDIYFILASWAPTTVQINKEVREGAQGPRAVQGTIHTDCPVFRLCIFHICFLWYIDVSVMAERAISDEAEEVQREAPRPHQIKPGHSRRGWATATGPKEGHSSRHGGIWVC
jgi:hypothetical protein